MPLAYSKYILLRHPKKNDPYIDERGVHVISIDWIDKYIEQAFPKAKRTHERFSNQTHYAFTQGKAKVELTLHQADEQYYLTIEVESRTLKRAVEVLEETEDKLMSTDIQKGYIDIKSYDGVSEYYCNLMYPLLNTLERKLRHLLLNVYTLKFEDTYFEQFDESIQDEAKSRIRQAAKPPFVVPQRRDDFGLKGKELRHVNRIRFFFEAISLGGLETLLFEKRVTDGEREEVAAFQEANEDLGKLPDAELREMFKKLEPRSDWERYFEQKVLYDDIEIAIGKIRETRNTVDHCKGFRKEYYAQAKDLTDGLIEAIDDAIRVTEEEGFEANNSKAIFETIKELARNNDALMESVRALVSVAQETYSQMFANLIQPWKDFIDQGYPGNSASPKGLDS